MGNVFELSFLGDISLNGKYETLYQEEKKAFEAVSAILQNSFVVGNVECFARGNDGVNELKRPRLETGIETLNYLKGFNLKVACLANNHVYDHLEDGFQKTISFLDKNGIKSLGASIDNNDFKQPLIIEKNGIKIGLLNYVTNDTNPNLPKGIRVKLNWFDLKRVIKDISFLKEKVDHIVLSLHWGGRLEGGMYPDWDQPIIARKLIDAGADLIIGHHSHTVQPYEIYKGKYIFYSLGNFCFSDIYYDGVLYSRLSPRQKKGMIPKIYFSQSSYSVNINYISNISGFIKIIKRPLFGLIYNYFFKFIKKNRFIWRLYFLKFKKINPIMNYLFIQKKSPFKALKLSKIKKHLTN